LQKPWVRVVLAVSIDGRITPANGGKANLGNQGDRRVLEESLSWSDGTLIGANTLRIHENICLIHDKNLINKRLSEEKFEQPISILISNKNNYSYDWMYFKQPIHRWLINPLNSIESNKVPKYFERLILFESNWSDILEKIFQSGIKKLVVLGGAKVVESLLIEKQVDELQITLTPKLLGGSHSWISHKITNLPMEYTEDNCWILNEVKVLEGSEIMLRYILDQSNKKNK
tara:strand:+ start:11756 stop:12445 length:690 start_codon:yes stop_codon:yes gene_type:complete